MTTTLSQDKTEVLVDDIILKLHQAIQYKIPNTLLLSDCKIEEFRTVRGSESVWAYVIDIGTGDKEWISLMAWKELYDAKLLSYASTEPIDDDLPF